MKRYPNSRSFTNFEESPASDLSDLMKQRQFMNNLSKELHLANKHDWYDVSARDISAHGGKGLVDLYGGSLHKRNYLILCYHYHL